MGLPVLPTHRHTDERACLATTGTAMNQDTVFANNLLVASHGDICTDGAGALNANADNVYVHTILVVGHLATAAADALCIPIGGPHCGPSTTEGSPDVFVGS
jgi:hypothetical protein